MFQKQHSGGSIFIDRRVRSRAYYPTQTDEMPCTHPACDGHRNASVGEVCLYCADNERSNRRFVYESFTFFVSSLRDGAADFEGEETHGE
jgi:hypothetical protein